MVVGSCITAVAPTAGQIFVGVSDSDVRNNHGSIAFVVGVGLPTVDQWLSGGAFECPKKVRSDVGGPTILASKNADGTNLPDGIDRAIISDGIAKVKADVMACGRVSPARGTVKVAVTVGSDGRVANVAVKPAPDRTLGNCVAAAVQGAMFSRTRSGGSFAYPFVF